MEQRCHDAAGSLPSTEGGSASAVKHATSAAGALWPHPDLPLFPLMLKPLAGLRSVLTLDGGSRLLADYADIKPTDLSMQELGHICEEISDLVQTLLYSRKSMSQLAALRIDVPDGFQLSSLVLSNRARVALQSRSFFDPMGQWRHCNLLELVSTHAMGAKLTMAFLLAFENGLNKQGGLLPSGSHLEDELSQLAKESLYASRCVDVFCKANGWSGEAPKSLTAISTDHGVSKERARQILSLANSSMERHLASLCAPALLVQAVQALQKHAPLRISEASALLVEQGITRNAFHPEGIVNAASKFNIDPDLVVAKMTKGEDVVLSPNEHVLLLQLGAMARSCVRSWGLVSAQWLLKQAEQEGLDGLSMEMVQLALESEAQLQPLDTEEEEPFWYWAGSHLKPSGAIVRCLKVIAYFGAANTHALHLDLKGVGARADLNLPGSLPLAVLTDLLEAWGLKQNEQDAWVPGTESAKFLCEQAMPSVERELADLIGGSKKSMDKSALKVLAESRGINANTFQSYLKRSALIAPTAKRTDPIELIDPLANSDFTNFAQK